MPKIIFLAPALAEISVRFPSPSGVNTKHCRIPTPTTEITGKTHLILFIAWPDNTSGSRGALRIFSRGEAEIFPCIVASRVRKINFTSVSQNCNLAWVSSGKFEPQNDSESGKFGAELWIWIRLKWKLWCFQCYSFDGSAMAVTEFRASAESGKFTLKSRSESGKLSTIGCHFPPKATNFGTMLYVSYLPCCRLPQSSHIAKSIKNRLQICKSRNLTEETLKI